MRSGIGLTLVLLSLTVPGELFAQGPPPPPPPPPPGAQGFTGGSQKTGTARLSGRVTALDTGRPIRRAVVRVTGQELRDGKSVSTDAEGRWELRDLPAGRFNLNVTKGGFVSLSYGQKRPFEPGRPLEVANGQVIEKLDIALPRGSAVNGRVVDEFGDPVANVRVAAMRYSYMGGQRRLSATSRDDMTDDLGNYRLHGLPPGDYYLSAQSTSFTFLGTSEDRTGYGQTFYPGTLNIAEAQRVSLSVGQEAQNIVIPLNPTRIVTLSGTAMSSEGKPVTTGMLMLRSAAANAPFAVSPTLVRDGAWTMSGVVPGEYVLTLQYLPNLEQVALTGTSRGIQNTEHVSMPITVGNSDMTGLTLTTSPGGIARGVIRFEGGKPPATTTGTTVMAPDPVESMTPMFSGGMVTNDWAFEARGLSGRRILRVAGLSAPWSLKSIMHDGRDITDSGIEVAPGQEVNDIEIVMTANAAELSGTVQNAKGAVLDDYVVVLFPPETEKMGFQSRHVKVARPDQTGRFTIKGVPAHSYLAVALEYLEPGEESNPEFLERMKSLATSVRVTEGEKKSVTLKLVTQ
jgi:hypothetical protein